MTEIPAGLAEGNPEARAPTAVPGLPVLVYMARDGDPAAFAEIVESLKQLVFRWSLTFARDIDEADEIAQETFVLMHRKLDQYRADSSLEGWVYRITRRVGLKRRRSSRRREALVAAHLPMLETVYNTDPGARVDRQRIEAYVRHFFSELPRRQREVFDLVDLQGHEPAEVARITGMKQGTVRANLFKARASIRAHILAAHPAWSEVAR
jgi:RNA polymerase sigma-70 factor (ECF subfamily)